MTAWISALIATAISGGAISFNTVIDTLAPSIEAAHKAFPECSEHVRSVRVTPAIEADDAGYQRLGLYRDDVIYLSASLYFKPAEYRQWVVFHEFAHCHLDHRDVGIFSELQADGAVEAQLFYKPVAPLEYDFK